ncbi:MAG: glycoside hydrolase family 3 C-terminal domain-containing protein, partial [bacterium]
FKAAIQEGGAWSIMCSYNRLNSVYACENKHLLSDILKEEWGFEGFAMSDWGAVHSTVETALAGLDVEMPNGVYMGEKLLEAVKSGKVPESVVDDKVRRILRVMMISGLFDGKIKVDETWLDSPEHRSLALEAAQEGIVLLKNENGVLPLDRKKLNSIAVIGPNATAARLGGGGSSTVTPTHRISPLEGIVDLAGDDVEIRHAMGCDLHVPVKFEIIPPEHLSPEGGEEGEHGLRGEYFSVDNFEGEPAVTRIDGEINFDWVSSELPERLKRDSFSVRWRGKLVPPVTGTYNLVAISNDGTSHLFINGKSKLNTWSFNGIHHGKSAKVKLKAGEEYEIRYDFKSMGVRSMVKLGWVLPGRDPIEDAAKLAGDSDAAIVFAGMDSGLEGEGHDRDSLELQGLQNELIEAVAAANPKTAVVLINGTPLMINRWLDKVPAVVEAWYPGQEGGRAISQILFGDVNPSGKLPVTLPHSWEECPAHGNYPGENGSVRYEEGIFLGYRYYDKENIDPVFPFGHGLSYTNFEYSGLEIVPNIIDSNSDIFKVMLDIKNTGARAGSETAQLYVRDIESSIERPVKELKGIRKIHLEPGESKKITFEIGLPALSFFDPSKNRWVAEPGLFEISIGSSSRDILLTGDLSLK